MNDYVWPKPEPMGHRVQDSVRFFNQREEFSMCMTGNQGKQILAPFASVEALAKLSKDAGESAEKYAQATKLGLGGGHQRIGVVTLPNGRAIYAIIGTSKTNNGWSGSFYTELSGYKVVVLASGSKTEQHFNAAIFRGAVGNEPVVSIDWTVKYEHSINGGGLTSTPNVQVAVDKTSVPKNCVIDCVLRHVDNCDIPCSIDEDACLVCGGAIAACCAINCHC